MAYLKKNTSSVFKSNVKRDLICNNNNIMGNLIVTLPN